MALDCHHESNADSIVTEFSTNCNTIQGLLPRAREVGKSTAFFYPKCIELEYLLRRLYVQRIPPAKITPTLCTAAEEVSRTLKTVCQLESAREHVASMDVRAADSVRILIQQIEPVCGLGGPVYAQHTNEPRAQQDARSNAYNTLYRVLSSNGFSCSSRHAAMIPLLKYDTGQAYEDSLQLLLSVCAEREHQGHCGWHEVHCSVATTSSCQPQSTRICSIFEKRLWKNHKPKLRFNEQHIWQAESEIHKYGHSTIQTLEELLSEEQSLKNAQLVQLQCAVAQTLYRLFDTPWIGCAWLSSSLKLKRSGRDTETGSELRWYADCPLWRQNGDDVPHPERWPNAEFMLRLAMLLVRLQPGLRGLSFSEKQPMEIEQMEDELIEMLDVHDGNFTTSFTKVIEACIEHDNLSRQKILTAIWTPLYDQLLRDHPKWASVATPPPFDDWEEMTQKHRNTTLIQRARQQITATETRIILPQQLSLIEEDQVNTLQSNHATSMHQRKLMMFDDEVSRGEPQHIESAKAFREDITSLRMAIESKLPELGVHRPSERIKIAVLDTGIDKSHRSIKPLVDGIASRRKESGCKLTARNPIKKCENFCEGPPDDECGHGTRVARLLLEFAPEADVYVAKVSRQLSVDHEASVKSVLKAINWATDQQADLVCLSFGYTELDRSIEEALSKLVGTGTTIFAAAANHGRTGPRAFPASMSSVFCVHACSGKGAWNSDINPSTNGYDDKWSALGVAVGFDKWDGEGCEHRSGTSYATPIALAILASFLDFIRRLLILQPAGLASLEKLCGPTGIKELLKKMVNTHDPDWFICPALLWPRTHRHNFDYLLWQLRATAGSF